MNISKNISRYTAIILGMISLLLFIMIFYIFSILNPKMVRFEELSISEMDLMNFVGAGLLLFFIFCLLTLYRTILYIKNSEKIFFFPLLLVVIGILSLLFIFGDIALISDIGKQYKDDLPQPEWYLLYPIMSFQFMRTHRMSSGSEPGVGGSTALTGRKRPLPLSGRLRECQQIRFMGCWKTTKAISGSAPAMD